MGNQKVLIHIGHNKSASTYLQKKVFPNTEGITFVDTPSGRPLRQMVKNRQNWDESLASTWLLEQKDLSGNKNTEKYIAISDEGLSGREHDYFSMDPFSVATNLKRIFPDAKILILIRNQISYLESLYSYRVSVKGREYRSFERFLLDRLPEGLANRLEYYSLAKHYIELFGKDNVCILPMEIISTEDRKFFSELSHFLSIPISIPEAAEKVNWSAKSLILLNMFRSLNFLLDIFLRPLRQRPITTFPGRTYKRISVFYNRTKGRINRISYPILKNTNQLSATPILRKLGYLDAVRESNQHSQGLLNIDLESLGYPM